MLAQTMSILTIKPQTGKGGRPRKIGTLMWDEEDHRHGIFLGYGRGDEKICASINHFERLMSTGNADYKVEVKITRREKLKDCLRKIFS